MSVWIDPRIAEIVAGLPGVTAEVVATAHRGAALLRKNIARDTGKMARSVRVSRMGSKDAFFGVADEGFIGYNFGHFNTWSQSQVAGSRVIERTIREMG